MAKVTWTEPAFEDLKLIFDFIATDSVHYADKVIVQIQQRVKMLEQHQKIGRVVPEFHNELIRELLEYSYRIVYRVDSKDQVTILRIHHQSQLLPPL